jgi:predicted patatin/cPLA2 family phospholipase
MQSAHDTRSCLIVEGGGFKTGFTSGILDAFIAAGYNPFDQFLGVSGGSVAISYFLSRQYRSSLESMLLLAKDKNFLKVSRSLGTQGYMDIDFIAEVASKKVPFRIDEAIKNCERSKVFFVTTNRVSGKAEYLSPNATNWLDVVVASCTLPFVTKGRHIVDGREYLDGGWSDPLPIKWAYENGARKILVLRTHPKSDRSKQSWADYFGSIYFRSVPKLSRVFERAYEKYNESLDYLDNPPHDLEIEQLTPSKLLKSTTYSYSKKSIMSDYRYGLDCGVKYMMKK